MLASECLFSQRPWLICNGGRMWRCLIVCYLVCLVQRRGRGRYVKETLCLLLLQHHSSSWWYLDAQGGRSSLDWLKSFLNLSLSWSRIGCSLSGGGLWAEIARSAQETWGRVTFRPFGTARWSLQTFALWQKIQQTRKLTSFSFNWKTHKLGTLQKQILRWSRITWLIIFNISNCIHWIL